MYKCKNCIPYSTYTGQTVLSWMFTLYLGANKQVCSTNRIKHQDFMSFTATAKHRPGNNRISFVAVDHEGNHLFPYLLSVKGPCYVHALWCMLINSPGAMTIWKPRKVQRARRNIKQKTSSTWTRVMSTKVHAGHQSLTHALLMTALAEHGS